MDNEKNLNEIEFLNNINSTLAVKTDYQNMQYDYEWIDKLEDAIPYIDNILRNPKRFIVNEEEIVKVELAKKTIISTKKYMVGENHSPCSFPFSWSFI